MSYRDFDLRFREAMSRYRLMMEAVGTPSRGVFYVVPTPKGWKVLVSRADVNGDEDHASVGDAGFWESVASLVLADMWSKKSNVPRRTIWNQIKDLYHACPRGRVVQAGKGNNFKVFWGEDFPRSLQAEVNSAFDLTTPVWIFDDHERATVPDREKLRRALGVTTTWKAADGEDELEDFGPDFEDALGNQAMLNYDISQPFGFGN